MTEPVARLDRAAAIAANLAYVLLVAGMLLALFPQARQLLRRLVAIAVWNYQLGTYLQNRQPTPGWVRRAQETPAEELAEE